MLKGQEKFPEVPLNVGRALLVLLLLAALLIIALQIKTPDCIGGGFTDCFKLIFEIKSRG